MQKLLASVALVGLAGAIVVTLTRADNDGAATAAAPERRPTTTAAVAASAPPVLAAEANQLVDLDGWLQTDIESLDDLRGNVVIVQFWTFGCINCKRTLPYLQELYAEHAGAGLEIVGVHSPEFTFEADPAAIAAAAEELGVTWPIALDTRQRNFFGWQGSRGYWPRTYVIDQQGQVRFDHVGEGKYEELAATVEFLLEESA
ncbi:MAG TPA: redoxin domain-containing protein [Acidimicrobiia bacterium]|jgi:thiol-disulfide isomerase/thioredoxin|nr:redoxin domain-containing protein [Acidimicrobiia bacterium]